MLFKCKACGYVIKGDHPCPRCKFLSEKKEKIIYQCTYENGLFKKRSEILIDIRNYLADEVTLDFSYQVTKYIVRRMGVESRRQGCPVYLVKVWGYIE